MQSPFRKVTSKPCKIPENCHHAYQTVRFWKKPWASQCNHWIINPPEAKQNWPLKVQIVERIAQMHFKNTGEKGGRHLINQAKVGFSTDLTGKGHSTDKTDLPNAYSVSRLTVI
uniref:Uncharacterized protein n=1 Tax=Anguilla anguilla TaxID=7936 RepID=A0A0E9WA46_ANGAN